MADNTHESIFKKLDGIKDDVHEIKQMIAVMAIRDEQRDKDIEKIKNIKNGKAPTNK